MQLFQKKTVARDIQEHREHLLLSLTRIEESFAAAALYSLGVSIEKVRAEMIEALKQP